MELLSGFFVSVLIYEIVKFKIYKSSILILYLGTINTFFFPIIYYSLLNGTAYKLFNEDTYTRYMAIGIIFIFFLITFTEIINNNTRIVIIIQNLFNTSIKNMEKLYSFCVFLFSIIYLGIYGRYLPIVELIIGKYRGIRPDTSGIIPHYIVLQTFMMWIIPMILLYYVERFRWKGLKRNLSVFLIFLLQIAGGNLGIAIYFIFFLWIYQSKCKFSIKYLILVGACIFAYFSRQDMQYTNIENLVLQMEAPMRRFFVTQAATLINYFSMVDEGYNFSYWTIPADVFRYIYGKSDGMAPTFYIGSFIVILGYIPGLIISILFLLVIMLIVNIMDNKRKNEDMFLYKKWAIYSILLFLTFASLSIAFFYRSIMILITLFVIDCDADARSWKNTLFRNQTG